MEKISKSIKIAILSSFTFSGIKDELAKQCSELNIDVDFYIGKYNQYAQEILNTNGDLYSFNPDLIIFFIDSRTVLGDLFFNPYSITDEERKKWADETYNNIINFLDVLKKNSSAKIIFHNFEEPSYSPYGIMESKQKFGFFESIEYLNQKLRDDFKEDNRVFIFDYNNYCSKIGKQQLFDPKMYYLGDIKLSFANYISLCHEYIAYIKSMFSILKKCIVLDLDNTLWGGIVGEDGFEGIKLGPTPEGRPFMEFQKHLLALYQKGIMFAINSKNNLDDALKVLREHPYMILKEDYFLAKKINWADKVTNIKELAEELNIGIDSFIFIDDDMASRQMVKEMLPEVEVIDLPNDPSLYSETLFKINSLNAFQITEEDKKRNQMYNEEKSREILKTSVVSIEEFIKSLELKVAVMDADNFTIPRISQLTQKTNQFNLTTKRYSEQQITDYANSNNYLVKCFQIEDKFGDYGITGVAIIKIENGNWFIDSFLLSCRVLGKNVEFAIMQYLIEEAKKNSIKKIYGEFIPTPKNKPAENYYRDCCFDGNEKNEQNIIFLFNINKNKLNKENDVIISQK